MSHYVPSRTCPCFRCKCNELMAPALLVTAGLLILFDNVDWTSFSHTWPLLLIVIGGVRILQSTASVEGHRPDGIPRDVPPAPVPAVDAPMEAASE